MKKWIRRLLWTIVILAVLMIIAVIIVGRQAVPILAAYTSKILCSAVFVSGRDPRDVLSEDVAQYSYLDTEVDREGKSVVASLFGLAERRALYRPGLGCTLVLDTTENDLRNQVSGYTPPRPVNGRPLPQAAADAPGIDYTQLQKTLDLAFQEPAPNINRRTRAVLILNKGEIIAERYAPGFSRETPLLGWSMTKSVTGTLIGTLVGQGKLALDQPAPVPEWSNPDDPRHKITLDQLMRMSSGLEFEESYVNPWGDALIMLFKSPDPGQYAASRPLEFTPDQKWSYSSGTTNILARIIRQTVGGSLTDYLNYPRQALFDPIGMTGAVMEPSPSGDFVGSSFMYATARDWARFGQLHLQDGVWEGQRILPEGWVKYCHTPTPGAPQGEYGAQWWLNAGAKNDPARRWLPHVPPDAYSAWGFEDQYVTIIPSKNLVIVRLGQSVQDQAWDHDAFITGIVAAVK